MFCIVVIVIVQDSSSVQQKAHKGVTYQRGRAGRSYSPQKLTVLGGKADFPLPLLDSPERCCAFSSPQEASSAVVVVVVRKLLADQRSRSRKKRRVDGGGGGPSVTHEK